LQAFLFVVGCRRSVGNLPKWSCPFGGAAGASVLVLAASLGAPWGRRVNAAAKDAQQQAEVDPEFGTGV
jgi:hypothetical protein